MVVEEQKYGLNWAKQKKACLERDSYICRKCGHVGEKIGRHWTVSAHHIRKVKFFVSNEGIFDWEKANDLSNLITLCEKNGCHRYADSHENKSGFVQLK